MNNQALFQTFVGFITAVHQITTDMTKDLRLEDITPVQYKILEYITVSPPDSITVSAVSDCLHLSLPNASRELRKLSEKDLCEKVPHPEDRRKQFIRLTPKGEAMMGEAFQRLGARFAERIETVTEAEREDIARAIDLLQKKVFY